MRGGAFSAGVEAPSGRTVYVSEGLDGRRRECGRRGRHKAPDGDGPGAHEDRGREAGGGMDDIVKVTVS